MAILAIVALLLALAIWRSLPHPTTIPGTRVTLDVPRTWETADARQTFDAAWVAEQKRKYPADAALIDSLIEGLQSGRYAFYAVIDADRNRSTDGSVIVSVSDDGYPIESLRFYATNSLLFQPVQAREGTATAEVALPTGPAVRLDWSYALHHADGTVEIAAVRSYWLIDGTRTVVIQLTTYGSEPAAVADFESVIQAMHWAS